MKNILVIFLFLTSAFAEVKIELSSGKELRCHGESKWETVCYSENNKEMFYFSIDDYYGYSGNVVLRGINLETNELITSGVSKVRNSDGEVTYSGHGGYDEEQDSTSTYQALKRQISLVKSPDDYSNDKNVIRDIEKYKQRLNEELRRTSNHFDDNNLIVNYNDKNLKCSRENSSSKETEYGRLKREALNSSNVCSLLHCEDGKKLFAGNNPKSYLGAVFEASENGNWEMRFPKEIKNSSGQILSLGNEDFFDSMAYPPSAFPTIGTDRFLSQELSGKNSLAIRDMSSPGVIDYIKDEIGLCTDSTEMKAMLSSLENYQQKIYNQDLVHYISEFNNVMGGFYLAPDKLPENTCHHDGTYYDRNAYENARRTEASTDAKTMDIDTAKELFDLAVNMDDIAWGFKEDGCYARAHLMARRFEDMGYYVDKAWIKGDLQVDQANGESINWNFHVAPVVYIKSETGESIPYVIDPSIMNAPVPLDEWTGIMVKHLPKENREMTKFPFPENAASMGRTAVALSNSDPYVPFENVYTSEEEKMGEAERTMFLYMGYIE